MARIKTSERRLLSAGSTGAKADIDIQSGKFAAIRGLVGTIDKSVGDTLRQMAHEQQTLYNSAAGSDNNVGLANTGVQLQQEVDGAKQAGATQEDYMELHKSTKESYIKKQRESQNYKDADKRTQLKIDQDTELAFARMGKSVSEQAVKETTALKNAPILAEIEARVKTGATFEDVQDLSGELMMPKSEADKATSKIIEEQNQQNARLTKASFYTDISQLQDQESSDALQEDIDNNPNLSKVEKEIVTKANSRAKTILFKQEERLTIEQYENDFLTAEVNLELTDLEQLTTRSQTDSKLSERGVTDVEQKSIRSNRRIRAKLVQNGRDGLKVGMKELTRIKSYEVISDLSINQGTHPHLRESLVIALESKGGTRGRNSPEFKEALKTAQNYDGTGFVEDDQQFTEKQELLKFIEDPENSETAKLEIIDTMWGAFSIDIQDEELQSWLGFKEVADETFRQGASQLLSTEREEGVAGELNWADEVIDLDEGQVSSIRRAVENIQLSIRGSNEEINWETAAISSNDAREFYMFMHQRSTIDLLSGFSTEVDEPNNLGNETPERRNYNDVVRKKLDELKLNHAFTKVQENISKINASIDKFETQL